MKRGLVLALIAGIAVVVVMIAGSEMGAIVTAFAHLGFDGFALILVAHAVVLGIAGLGWGALGHGALGWFVFARLVRDGAAEVLPLSQLGGFVLGTRALVLGRISTSFAAASTVVDVTMELIAQLFYTLLGIWLLLQLRPDSPLARPAGLAVLGMAGIVALFILAQSRGAGAVERFAVRLTQRLFGTAAPGGQSLQAAIHALHGRPRALGLGILLHLVAWVLVGLETWLMLKLIGSPVSLAAAVVIDSLLSGLRSAAFMVPQALGVQEGGYILLGGIFGVSPEAALAISLIRRARDIAIGAPSLVLWQAMEGPAGAS